MESVAWTGLEETAGGSPAKHHVGSVCRFIYFFLFKEIMKFLPFFILVACLACKAQDELLLH